MTLVDRVGMPTSPSDALQPFSRIQVLLLLLLPALCVPRGVLLGFCLCDDGASACGAELVQSCCPAVAPSGCCDGDEDSDHEQLIAADSCACCGTIELDDFDESVPGAPTVLEHGPAVALHLERASPAQLTRLGRVVPSRAPPEVLPPGLRPGVAPLLL